jgi:hypothetical protein
MQEEIRLNLGCGKNHKDGYINVDKYGDPDIQHDLELFPWPWDDSSVSQILLNHVLEHLGQETETYLNIMKELYRVCVDQALITIVVPHPRHDDFINDPTHVRKVTPDGMRLFSKKNNEAWIEGGFANSPLGVYLDVDFEVMKIHMTLDSLWQKLYDEKKISEDDVRSAASRYNNVIKEIRMEMKVIKS